MINLKIQIILHLSNNNYGYNDEREYNRNRIRLEY